MSAYQGDLHCQICVDTPVCFLIFKISVYTASLVVCWVWSFTQQTCCRYIFMLFAFNCWVILSTLDAVIFFCAVCFCVPALLASQALRNYISFVWSLNCYSRVQQICYIIYFLIFFLWFLVYEVQWKIFTFPMSKVHHILNMEFLFGKCFINIICQYCMI